ncbi:glycosyltransferase [Mesobacillus foraminis]|uniref:glycosyltransferase n=1 Tax=Mesobacillus foraminis TaxID=279826 RepID=UPI0039A3F370
MKKSILFMVINMNIGGTEKALLNMISEMPKEEYDVTILMLEKKGGFLNSVPNWVNVEYVEGYKEIKKILNDPPKTVFLHLFKQLKFISAFTFLFFYLYAKIRNDRNLFYRYYLRNTTITDKEHDVAVAYAGPMDFISFFVVNKIKSKRKIQWIHFDITNIGFNKKFASKIYNEFDKIFVVSKEGKQKVLSILPHLKNKTEEFFNIISPTLIKKMGDAGTGFEDDFNGIRILTVGRLSKEKGQDITISVLARLKEAGYKVRWYCVGEGSARGEYEKLIKENDVENDYKLLGSTSNPYPFMKQCDIYVQPSRHEGFCITLSEARCFSKPIVSTNFTGSCEQIFHEQTGLLVNFDEQQMFKAISRLLNDYELRDKFKKNMHNQIIDKMSEMEKLYKVANVDY